MQEDPDAAVRQAAFARLEELRARYNRRVPSRELAKGFPADGGSVKFLSKAIGIFKPRSMSAALSVSTRVPRPGRDTFYADQGGSRDDATGLYPYDLQHGGMDKPANRFLHLAWQRGAPLIWFFGVEPEVYEPVYPVWVAEFGTTRVGLAAHDPAPDLALLPSAEPGVAEVREAPALEVARFWRDGARRERGHQGWFSRETKTAYGWRCALSGLPVRNLLESAHIIPDAQGGRATVQNGICLSVLHHQAFDRNLIGIDTDCRVHVSPRLVEQQDGPLLEGLKKLKGETLQLPQRPEDHPRRDWLGERYKTFLEAVG